MVNEYERVVIFRLGRLSTRCEITWFNFDTVLKRFHALLPDFVWIKKCIPQVISFQLLSGVKGPGVFLIITIVDKATKIDLRVVTIDIPKQAVITRDNVTVDVDAVVYYKVVEPGAAIAQVENYRFATSTLSQTTIRDVLGQMELDELLSEREQINKQIQELLDAYTDPWGIKVTGGVTIRDVSLPETMKRAIAKQAEAEREKRSRIILAEGESQAAQKMTEAASLWGNTYSDQTEGTANFSRDCQGKESDSGYTVPSSWNRKHCSHISGYF